MAPGPMKLRKRTRGRAAWRAGFTITEAIVASSILLVAVVPILKALSAATSMQTTVERKTQSVARARAKLDEIRARCVYHYDEGFAETPASLGGSYLGNVSDDEDADLRLVTVSVGYDANADGTLSSSEVEVTLATYIANRL